MRLLISVALVCMSAIPAFAGFERWTVESEKDPFSGGLRTTINYMSSVRSGVLVICDSAQKGLEVRMIPGFAYEASLEGYTPDVEFAIDGERLMGQPGVTGSVGDNLAASMTMLTGDTAQKFVDAFAGAKSQIAIKDGIADRPYLLNARGSTKAGDALVKCMAAQSK